MKSEIKYVELKSGDSHTGPAWIGLVSYSKSGKTIYFDGKAFQSLNGRGIKGNYVDIETGEEYWISGVKKDLTDRHWVGGGVILVEKRILSDYLKLIERETLPNSMYEVTTVQIEKPIKRINEYENKSFEPSAFDSKARYKQPNELTVEELKYVIDELRQVEKDAKYNKGRRSCKRARSKFEEEIAKRENNVDDKG